MDVSRETSERLTLFWREVLTWQKAVNLVGRTSIPDGWQRHIDDSAQLAELSDAAIWADLGSGAGLPGMVIAILRPGSIVHLIESDSRKCAFLRHVARLTGTGVHVWEGRIEAVAGDVRPVPQTVVSRALAPLGALLGYAAPWLAEGALGLFPKGKTYAAELTRARESWTFAADVLPSRTDPDARIIRISRFEGSAAGAAGQQR